MEDLSGIFGPILRDIEIDEDRLIVVQLAYHVALYVNPTADFGFDDRYCICSLAVADMAIEKYREIKEIWYWQKHHNKNLRSVKGYLYTAENLCLPEYALTSCQWNADQLRADHPFEFGTPS